MHTLPPYLETRELGRMPLVTHGPEWSFYEHIRPNPNGSRHTLTFMVHPPRSHAVNATELAAEVDRFWSTLWSSLGLIAERATEMVNDKMQRIIEPNEYVPAVPSVLTAERLYVVEYGSMPGVEAPCTLTFDVYELECREILTLRMTTDFRPLAVEFDG